MSDIEKYKKLKYPRNFIYYIISIKFITKSDMEEMEHRFDNLDDNVIKDTISYVVKNSLKNMYINSKYNKNRVLKKCKSIEYTLNKRFGIDTDGILKPYYKMRYEYDKDRENKIIDKDTSLRTEILRSFIESISDEVLCYLLNGGIYSYIDSRLIKLQNIINKLNSLNLTEIYNRALDLPYVDNSLDIGNYFKQQIKDIMYGSCYEKPSVREVLEYVSYLGISEDNKEMEILQNIANFILENECSIHLLNTSKIYKEYIDRIVNQSIDLLNKDDRLYKYSKICKSKDTFRDVLHEALSKIGYEQVFYTIIFSKKEVD